MSTINAYVYIKILGNFLTPLIENWFNDAEVIFQDNNKFYHRVKGIKVFIQERHIKINEVSSLDLNPLENLWK